MSLQFTFLALLLHSCLINGSRLAVQKQKEFDKIANYELIYLNLERLEADNIIELDAYSQHYEIQLIRNDEISPMITHQSPNKLAQQSPSSQESWYAYLKFMYLQWTSTVFIYTCLSPYTQPLSRKSIKLSRQICGCIIIM